MKPESVLGGLLGIAIIAVFFLLPFWSIPSGDGSTLFTLRDSAGFVLANVGGIASLGSSQAIILGILIVTAALFVLVSGVIGYSVRNSGIYGLVGIVALTLGPYLISPDLGGGKLAYGIGFWAIWFLVVANLLAGTVAPIRRRARVAMAPKSPEVYEGPPIQ